MKTQWPVVLIGALLAGSAMGQTGFRQPIAVHSQSGQFVVSRATATAPNPLASVLTTNRQVLEVDPTLLVVSCERVKQAVWRQLGLTSPWRGKVFVSLFPATGPDHSLTLTAEHFRDEWRYRLLVPDLVDRTRLLQGLVQVVLLEAANRTATDRSAELPPWLAVGFTDALLATSETEFLFTPPRKEVGGLRLDYTVITNRELNKLTALNARLREHSALTLQELSWPTESDLNGDTAAAYHASAQVFVSELLRLKGGSACLRTFLAELPCNLNWQTAFLKAFGSHFNRLLDVEKWWALQAVYLGGRDLMHIWPAAESWRKLEEAVRIPAQTRAAADQLPTDDTTIPLQTVIARWNYARQTTVLRARLAQLDLVRQRVNPEVLELTEAYRQLLNRYLAERDRLGPALAPGPTLRPKLQRLIDYTVNHLNALDERLAASRPSELPATTNTNSATTAAN